MTLSVADEPTTGTQVVWLSWDQYLRWMTGKLTAIPNAWGDRLKLGEPLAPGQHMAIIGPTGCAKTTHAVGFLAECRKYVLALDPKGEDETLAASGYVRVKNLPHSGLAGLWDRLTGQADQQTWHDIHQRIENGQNARVIVGGGSRTDKEDEALRTLMREAISYCRHQGGWTLYVDEFELLSSQRMMRLGDRVERMLITARRDLTSVITSFQSPAWVSTHATKQARRAVVYPQSGNSVKTIAEKMVWDWRELAAILDQLPPYHTVTIGRGRMDGPAVITMAPKLASRKPEGRPDSRARG